MVKLNFPIASSRDIPDIIALAKKIWLPAFSRYFDEDELDSLFTGMYSPEKINEVLSKPSYTFHFVRDQADNCLGYFAFDVIDETLKLDKIYIAPEIQGQGLGQQVFDHIGFIAQKAGASTIILNVNRRNAAAIGFYKKLGFEIIAEEDIPGPNGFVYDDYVMEVKI